jgi:hypothetical protein
MKLIHADDARRHAPTIAAWAVNDFTLISVLAARDPAFLLAVIACNPNGNSTDLLEVDLPHQ